MKSTARIAGIGGLALAAAALAVPASASASVTHAAPARSSAASSSGAVAGQVFVQTDGLGGNRIVAYDRGATGGLTQAGVYATGGVGGQLTGSMVDHTASEARWRSTAPTAGSTPSTPAATRSRCSRCTGIGCSASRSSTPGERSR